MEQVKKFDALYKKQESYNFLMFSIGKYIFLVAGLFLTLMTFVEGEIYMAVYAFVCLGWSVILHLRPYLIVFENGKQINIYKMLKWMPVRKEDIWKVRAEYLKEFMRKISIVVVIEQIIVVLFSGSFEFFNTLYVIGVLVVVWLSGIICIVFPS